jgi:3-deoxy-D-manno-octulosonic-acid transferase
VPEAVLLRRALRSDAARALFVRVVGLYLGVALRTTRWRVEAHPDAWPHLIGAPGPDGKPRTAVVAFWHEFLPLLPVLWWHALRVNHGLTLHVLISRHRDGRLIADIVRRWDIQAIAGSSDNKRRDTGREKGGAAAFRTLLELLRGGGLVAITPDGPRGPRHSVQGGVLRLAALAGAPVVPVAAECRPAWRINSWDRMLLPVPFGRGRLVCGAPVSVPRHGWDAQEAALQTALHAVAADAKARIRR